MTKYKWNTMRPPKSTGPYNNLFSQTEMPESLFAQKSKLTMATDGIAILKNRFKNFAIKNAELIQMLPKNPITVPYCNQLIRSSSSSGANYRAACRDKSTPDFINKLKIVEEELDESIYFLELLLHFNPRFAQEIQEIVNEGSELLAIIVKSIKTARQNVN